MALFLLNYMKFRSGLNISPLNRNLCVLLYLFFAADDKRFTSLNDLRLHINTVHLPKRLRCVEYEYATNKRHTYRGTQNANTTLQNWMSSGGSMSNREIRNHTMATVNL